MNQSGWFKLNVSTIKERQCVIKTKHRMLTCYHCSLKYYRYLMLLKVIASVISVSRAETGHDLLKLDVCCVLMVFMAKLKSLHLVTIATP